MSRIMTNRSLGNELTLGILYHNKATLTSPKILVFASIGTSGQLYAMLPVHTIGVMTGTTMSCRAGGSPYTQKNDDIVHKRPPCFCQN